MTLTISPAHPSTSPARNLTPAPAATASSSITSAAAPLSAHTTGVPIASDSTTALLDASVADGTQVKDALPEQCEHPLAIGLLEDEKLPAHAFGHPGDEVPEGLRAHRSGDRELHVLHVGRNLDEGVDQKIQIVVAYVEGRAHDEGLRPSRRNCTKTLRVDSVGYDHRLQPEAALQVAGGCPARCDDLASVH